MITPKSWGPHFWMFFHLISLKFPENPSELDKSMARDLIDSIPYILPCKMCKNHFRENIARFPLDDYDIRSKNSFILWFIDLHNKVNLSLDKKVLSRNIAQNNVIALNQKNYFDRFQKILEYIGYDIDDEVSFNKCQGIKKFIKVVLYFGGKKYNINFDFDNYESFKHAKKHIFEKYI